MSQGSVAVLDPENAIEGCAKRELVNPPTHVTIEHTSSCNLRCFFCEHHRDEAPVKSGLMNETLLEKIETELSPGASTIACTVSGEPFLDRRLQRIARIVEPNPGQILAVTTNGLLMNERKLAAFADLQAPLYVSVSMDTVEPGVYGILRRGSDYAEVIENVKRFKDRGRSLGIREAHLGISSVLMTHTLPGIPDLVRFAADIGAETVGLAHLTVFQERDLPLSLFKHKARTNAVLAESLEIARRLNVKMYAPPPFALTREEIDTYERTPRPACPYLAGRVYINLDGEVEMCCRKGRPKTGNMFAQSFASIWNGDVYRQYRERYAADDPMPICTNCFVIETYKPYLLDESPFILL